MVDRKIDAESVRQAVSAFRDPESGRSILVFDQLRDLQIADNQLTVTLALSTHSAPLWPEVCAALEQQLRTAFGQLTRVTVQPAVLQRPAAPRGEFGLTIKSIVAVGSGKGGVGKSTIATSLAVALQRAGCRVGVLDADVYGPSVPHLLGLQHETLYQAEGKLQPVICDGMPVVSIGFLVPPGEAVIWRGPMLHGAITQFLRDTAWGELDYLIIDMPPGTGDVALTLSQVLPLTGAVVVCTPQDVALLDATKAIAMFRKVGIPVLGMVENMSGFVCPDCGKRYDIFGSGGARQRAEQLNVPFLGQVPINIQIRVHGDEGRTGSNFDDPAVADYLRAVAQQLVRNIAAAAAEQPRQPELPMLS